MKQNSLKILASAVVVLGLLMFVLRSGQDDIAIVSGGAFLPDLASVADEISSIQIERASAAESLQLERAGEDWTVTNRDGYAANAATVRQLIIALADARIVEEKTSNPANYDRLGVGNPTDGGSGTAITLSGGNVNISTIIGDVAQGESRFARASDAATSFLIDQNPQLPESIGDWLKNDVLDINSSRVQRVATEHADGESIVIEKEAAAETDFEVRGIPLGRELSYATVANATGGALSGLTLTDVRSRLETEPTATVRFDLFNGLAINVAVSEAEDGSWLTFAATAEEPPATDDADADAATENGPDEAAEISATEEAATINARLGNWQYRIADYKQDLLVRRWDDILKAEDES